MKKESLIYLGLGSFFVFVCIVYVFLGTYDDGKPEFAGITALALVALMMFMLGGYLQLTGRKMDLRPEDLKDAEVVDGAGDVGFFPPRSIWPFWSAVTGGLIFLGPVFGWWLTFLGLGLGAWSLAGWIYQYYVGDYQH